MLYFHYTANKGLTVFCAPSRDRAMTTRVWQVLCQAATSLGALLDKIGVALLKAETRAARSARHYSDNASAATRERERSGRARTDAEAFAARLVLSEEDLAAANVKALEWLQDWEKNAKK